MAGFELKSGNKPSGFKLMGATDPADQFIKDKDLKTKQDDDFTVSNYLKAEKEYKELRKSKGRDKLVNLEERYNTTFKKDKDGVFRNPEGKSPSELEETRLTRK